MQEALSQTPEGQRELALGDSSVDSFIYCGNRANILQILKAMYNLPETNDEDIFTRFWQDIRNHLIREYNLSPDSTFTDIGNAIKRREQQRGPSLLENIAQSLETDLDSAPKTTGEDSLTQIKKELSFQLPDYQSQIGRHLAVLFRKISESLDEGKIPPEKYEGLLALLKDTNQSLINADQEQKLKLELLTQRAIALGCNSLDVTYQENMRRNDDRDRFGASPDVPYQIVEIAPEILLEMIRKLPDDDFKRMIQGQAYNLFSS